MLKKQRPQHKIFVSGNQIGPTTGKVTVEGLECQGGVGEGAPEKKGFFSFPVIFCRAVSCLLCGLF